MNRDIELEEEANPYGEYIEVEELISKKRQRDFNALSRKKVKKEISDTSKAINRIARFKKKKDYFIQKKDFYQNYGNYIPIQNPTEEQIEYFYQLFKASEKTRSISIFKQICYKPIKTYTLRKRKLTFITNDTLFWYSVFNPRQIVEDKEKQTSKIDYIYENTYFSDICSYYDGEITRIELGSTKAFALNSNTKTEEFYFQDSSASYSLPNSPLTNEEAKSQNANQYKITFLPNELFRYQRRNFIKATIKNEKTDKTAIILCPLGDNSAQVENNIRGYVQLALQTMVKIKQDEKSLVKGIKEIKYKSGVYFFEKTLFPTTFCPETLMNLPELEYNIMAEAESDPTVIFDYWIAKPDSVYIEHLFNMENITDLIEFLYVISVTQPNMFNGKNNIKSVIRIYFEEDGKESVLKYMKLYKLFCRTCLYFFDSFQRKASLERMNEVKKRIRETLRQYDTISSVQKTIFSNIVNTLGSGPALLCTNFSKYDIQGLLLGMEHCANLIVNNPTKEVEQLELEIRSLGSKIYDILITGNTPIICSVRSGGSFLQNIVGKNDYKEVKGFFTDLINKLRNQQVAQNIKKEKKDVQDQQILKQNLIDNIKSIMGVNTPPEIQNYNVNQLNQLYNQQVEKMKKIENDLKQMQVLYNQQKSQLDNLEKNNLDLNKQILKMNQDALVQQKEPEPQIQIQPQNIQEEMIPNTNIPIPQQNIQQNQPQQNIQQSQSQESKIDIEKYIQDNDALLTNIAKNFTRSQINNIKDEESKAILENVYKLWAGLTPQQKVQCLNTIAKDFPDVNDKLLKLSKQDQDKILGTEASLADLMYSDLFTKKIDARKAYIIALLRGGRSFGIW